MTSGDLTHPYFLSTVEELDDISRPFAQEFVKMGHKPVTIFVSPANMYPRKYRFRLIPQKILIFSDDGVMQISHPENKNEKPIVNFIESKDILFVRNNIYLLYGKLEIWSGKNITRPEIEIEYNTVAHYSLRPYVRNLIEQSWKNNQNLKSNLQPDTSFEELFKISYSYYNGLLTEGLHKDEEVLSVIYQTEIHRKYWGIFTKKIFPDTCFAFTNRQMIILQQDLRYRVHHEWLFTFISLFQCSDLKISEGESCKICKIDVGQILPLTFLLESHNMDLLQKTYLRWKEQTSVYSS
ncbi:hypothetical protein [Leptolinea tardivitalis]|uniref:Uncharacterized protein n=1 Tax=Leptolinea tardivitalis TaxID=229920 RepID=A0A0N8GKU7_9CHLR|nr:hypothetical protein [Leptolinea tardivitalis]KPL70690.1 hypothetical protein ADM99_16535 [Leptolinea tardivitalis]GAP22323.1 hypothetical protein LTAR_02554 [Leptolinea tardivitalis]